MSCILFHVVVYSIRTAHVASATQTCMRCPPFQTVSEKTIHFPPRAGNQELGCVKPFPCSLGSPVDPLPITSLPFSSPPFPTRGALKRIGTCPQCNITRQPQSQDFMSFTRTQSDKLFLLDLNGVRMLGY